MSIFAKNRDPHRMAAVMLEEGRGKRKGTGQKGRVSVGRQEAMAAAVYTGNSGQRRQRDWGRGRPAATEQVHLTGDSLPHFVLSHRVHMVLSSGRAESSLGRSRVLSEA